MPNMLPKLKNSSIRSPQSSSWSNDGINFLDDLAKSMEINGNFAESGKISSIPDVWARPLLFEMAMFETADSKERQFAKGLHERVIGEWRSILAMIALKDIRHVNIKAKEIHIQADNSVMEEVLYKMKPDKSIDDGMTSWDDIHVLYLNDKPIAMTSPTTLVCAAADYERAFSGTIPTPWSDDRGQILSDPIERLNPEDRGYIYAWLEELIQGIKNLRNTNDITNNIMTCIHEYRDDLKASMSRVIYDHVDSGLGFYSGIFALMNHTAKAKPGTPDDSDVKITPSVNCKSNYDYIMADPDTLDDIARVWNVNKNSICVWAGISANDVTEDKLNDNDRFSIGGTMIEGAKYIRPSDIFTDKVFVVTLTNEDYTLFAFTHNIASGNPALTKDHREIIPPIRKDILEYFDVKYLRDNLYMEYQSFSLTVKLTLQMNNGKRYTVSKTYDLKDTKKGEFISSIIEIPFVDIWPNEYIPNWHKYYLSYLNNQFDRKDLAVDMPFFEPWSSNDNDRNIGIPNSGLSNMYTAQLYNFPEALLCRVVRNNGDVEDVGILLVNKPDDVYQIGSKSWNIGIDFGTSSTMVYYTEGKNQPKPLVFNSRLQSLTKSNDFNHVYHLGIHFIPRVYDSDNGSFPTIFQALQPIDNNTTIKPLIDGRIFPLTVERASDFSDLSDRVFPNLKWDTEQLNKRMAASFIEQVCLQCAIEAATSGVNNITWNFSYPSAFSNTDRIFFENATENAVQDALANTIYQDKINVNPISMESIATAAYFNKLNNTGSNFVDGAICLDIGAGTTDISIVSGMPGRIVYHTSVQYAGRTLFRPIYKWLEERIYNGGNIGSINIAGVDITGFDEERKNVILDAVMRAYSDSILTKELGNIYNNNDGSNGKVEEMLLFTQFAITGLFYYVGTILGELYRRGIFVEDKIPDVYIGGNGSRVFRWITGGGRRFRNNDVHLDVFKNALVEAANISNDMRFSINLSEIPKIEVAAGMLTEKPQNELFNEEQILRNLFGAPDNGGEVDAITAASVMAAEEYLLEGVPCEVNNFISAVDIRQGIKVKELPNIAKMLDCFNSRPKAIWGTKMDISDDDLYGVIKRVNGYYVCEMPKDVNDIRVEPVFLIAMKELVERIVNQLEEVDNYD